MEYNRKETNQIIKEKEAAKDFNSHINPVDWDNAYPVDGSFKYLNKGILTSLKYSIYNLFEVNPFVKKVNKDFKTKIVGLENLKGLKSAIITCNHVHKFDCLILKGALSKTHHKVYITAAAFNNQKGHFGELMRAGGLMPLSDNLSAMKNFTNALEAILKTNSFVVFYPEQAMWLYYRKPRPYKNGAYHYASKYNVPIVPTFITFEDSDELDEEGLPKQYATLHIMSPIYPQDNLTFKENIDYLNKLNSKLTKDKYEEFYKKVLSYGD